MPAKSKPATPATAEATDENTVAIDEISDRWERYVKAKAAEALGKKAAEEAKADIAELMKSRGAEFATVDGELVARYRPIPKPRFQEKKFKESHPDLADEFTIMVDEWRLERVK